jgi:hypothetical protein
VRYADPTDAGAHIFDGGRQKFQREIRTQ